MADARNLHDAFLDELRDTYDAERQITKALPKLAKAASSPELRAAFESHLAETREQVSRLEEVFGLLDEKASGKHCDGVAGILEEGKAVMAEDFDQDTMDACLIASAQRVEHYEMAAYGTLIAWAEAMGHEDVVDLLRQTLDEEKAADEALSGLGQNGINERASQTASGNEEEGVTDEEIEVPAKPIRGQLGMAGATIAAGERRGTSADRKRSTGSGKSRD